MVQYPTASGVIKDWTHFITDVHKSDTLVVSCTDLLASVLFKPVGEMGADIAVGSAQRFGVPMVGHRGPISVRMEYTNPSRVNGI